METPPSPPPRPRLSAFWPCVLLGAALAILKATQLDAFDWRGFAAVVHEDLLFALGLGAAAEAALFAAAGRRSLARGALAAVVVLGAVTIAYAALNLEVVQHFARPFTFPLLRLLGTWRDVRSSLAARLTAPLVLGLAGAVAVYVAASLAAVRLLPAGGARAKGAAVLAVAAIAFAGRLFLAAGWEGSPGLVESAPWALLASAAGEIAGGRSVELPRDFPPEYARELATAGERGGPATFFESAAARPRNVILIVLESTGTRYLSLYGSPYATTPRLAAEAKNAIVFDDFYAHVGYTFCSLVAINYAAYPGFPWAYVASPAGVPTLAGVLHERGYRTAYVHSGDLEWRGEDTQLRGHGFDEILDYRDLGCPQVSSWGVEDRCAIDGALRFVDAEPGGRPFFAMLWTDQTHDPYALAPGEPVADFFQGAPPPPHAAELGRYLNVLRTVDRQLGRLFDALRERGLADDTLVAITGDHGEAFGAPHAVLGHGSALFEECLHVPLVLWNPRLFGPAGGPGGRRGGAIGAHADLNPTVLDVLGLGPPASWQGRSLFDPARPPRAYLVAGVAGRYDYLFGVREEGWKYIFNPMLGRETLFDLRADPDEEKNVAAAEPARCRRLRERLGAWVASEETYRKGH